ncbi:MAG TPA: right-handed parallel beta-helix repeat-containing protein, partial [Rugosimonospora sp.]|nr:right-handed parallel beta-helix repeat-containing protein [Rugosimonospora sp.]
APSTPAGAPTPPSPTAPPNPPPAGTTPPAGPPPATGAPPPQQGSSTCPLPRHPDASCTGVPAGVALRSVAGNVTVTTAGTVIDAQDIHGCVRVQAPGVVIRRSRISCANFIAVASFHGDYRGTGLLIEDSEVDCDDGPGTGVSDSDITALRLNIHGCENGFSLDSDVQVSDSYVHDLFNSATSHTDGIEMEGGTNIVVTHNTLLDGPGTSAIITDPTKMSNLTISDNLLAGGAYTLYCPRDTSSGVRVLDNRVSREYYATGGQYGPWTDCQKVAQVSGNIWDDTGQPLAF